MANVCQNTLTLLEMVTMPTKDEDIQKFVGVSPDLEANLRILSLQVSILSWFKFVMSVPLICSKVSLLSGNVLSYESLRLINHFQW